MAHLGDTRMRCEGRLENKALMLTESKLDFTRRATRGRPGDVVGEASWTSSVINLVNTSKCEEAYIA